ncbi:MAG: hypothetical protein ABSA30_14450, partial [Candidatus Aminicenantales bacterium]
RDLRLSARTFPPHSVPLFETMRVSTMSPRPQKTWIARGLIGLLLVSGLAGCTALDLTAKLPWSTAAPKPEIPSRMIDLWSFTVLTQEGLPGVRGFGGRVMFYNDTDEKPVAVDGAFTVFAFDETSGDLSYSSPDKKFLFPVEKLSKHYSKSELGHSYSFWLPWDEVGGPERKICLIARFQPKNGSLVISKPSHQVLPGEPSKTAGQEKRASYATGAAVGTLSNGVYPVSHQAPLDDDRRESETMFTIDVPPSFARPGVPPPSPAGTTSPALPPSVDPRDERPRQAAGPNSADASLADRFARRRFPAQKGPSAPQRPDPIRRQPFPAVLPSALPPTPRPDSPGAVQGTSSGAGSTPN